MARLAELLKNTILVNENLIFLDYFGVEGANTVHLSAPYIKLKLEFEVERKNRPANLQVNRVLAIVHVKVALYQYQCTVFARVILQVKAPSLVYDVCVAP